MNGHRIVRSKDATAIAYDSAGDGPALILVGGAFSFRRYKSWVQLFELLAPRFRVISYDRRGRGDSGDASAYAVEREIEDLDVLVRAVGGSARAFGMSSGGVLALRAAAAGVPLERAVVYQPPFSVEANAHVPPLDFGRRLGELAASGNRGATASYFMREGMGAPRVFVGLLRVARPIWRNLEAVAHTLPYDDAVVARYTSGQAPERPGVDVPALVLAGGRSPQWMRDGARAVAASVPGARYEELPGQTHNVKAKAAAPVLAAFFTGLR